MSNDLIPISEEQAKAVQEVAKAVGQGIEAASKFFSWCADAVGDAPRNAFARVIGDRLYHSRIRNIYKLQVRTEEILNQRGVHDRKPVSEDIATPLFDAARQQDSDELRELYAGLLAAAMDPARANTVRLEFVEAVKRFHPQDAVMMKMLRQHSGQLMPNTRDFFASHLKISADASEVALRNLANIGCIGEPMQHNTNNYYLTAFGRELMAACSA